jgi:hypothetical protein
MTEESRGEIVIYRTRGGKTALEVNMREDTVWLSQVQMSQLFEKDRRTISEHINNVFKEKELSRNRTIRKFRIVQKEGGRSVEREIDFYNLDVIISVGYLVKSQRGTQFRIWATQVLKDHLLKGYSINEKRLREENTRLLELQKTVGLLLCSGERKINHSGVPSARFTRPLTVKKSIRALKKRQHTCFILWLKTTLSLTETSASGLSFLSGFWTPTVFCIPAMDVNG